MNYRSADRHIALFLFFIISDINMNMLPSDIWVLQVFPHLLASGEHDASAAQLKETGFNKVQQLKSPLKWLSWMK